MAASDSLKARGVLSNMRKPHVNPPVSGFDATAGEDYVMRS